MISDYHLSNFERHVKVKSSKSILVIIYEESYRKAHETCFVSYVIKTLSCEYDLSYNFVPRTVKYCELAKSHKNFHTKGRKL